MAKKRKHRFRGWLLMPVLALAMFGLVQIAAVNPSWVEKWYSTGIYPVFAKMLSWFSAQVPFSIDDLFYVLLVFILLAILLSLAFRKITFARAGKIILNIMAAVYIAFYLFWGFNYFREDVNLRLGLDEQAADTETFVKVLGKLISATNRSQIAFTDFEISAIDSLVENAYRDLASALQIDYPMGRRPAKAITFSVFFAQAGISGYYGPFFNEVHVNSKILPMEFPFVLAHEKAHQFGITSEAEANFYAWLVCSQSHSKQLQYSANLHILRFFLFQAMALEEYPEMVAKIDDGVKADFQRISENWAKMRNDKIDKIASKVNDTYLKTNKIEKGIDDYHGVVKFVMDYSQDPDFQKP